MTKRTPQAALALYVAIAATMVPAARAQEHPAPHDPATNGPPISRDCANPAMPQRSETALPAVTAALKDRKALKILTMGGSTRAGADPQNDGYNAIIERLLETSLKGISVTFTDLGVSGELVRNAVDRIKAEVALNPPDLVIWQVGTNDALSNIPPDEFEAELTEGVRWLKEHNTDLVLIGVHFSRGLVADQHYQAIRQAVKRVAAAEHVLRVGHYEAAEWIEKSKAGGPPLDEFIMLEQGYACLAEYVARAITSSVLDQKIKGKTWP